MSSSTGVWIGTSVHSPETVTAGDTRPWEHGPMSDATPRFLTLADVAEVLNVTVRQVYALVRSGELKGIQIGGRNQWRVENDQLEDYIRRQYARAEQAVAELSDADLADQPDDVTR